MQQLHDTAGEDLGVAPAWARGSGVNSGVAALGAEDLGEQRLRDVEDTVRVFRIALGGNRRAPTRARLGMMTPIRGGSYR